MTRTLLSACLLGLMACNATFAGPPADDMVCGLSVAWYESTPVADPNTSDPNTLAAAETLCCPDADLVPETDDAGAAYECCPASLLQNPPQTANVSCIAQNLLTEVSDDDF